jgi:membrane protein DedA with SNARE-associated domain
MFDGTLTDLIATHGYWLVATIVALESMGLPLPGETVLVTAAIYAGTTHEMNIAVLVAAAAVGATLGDNVGYWVGRRFGYGLLVSHGDRVGLTVRRIKLGQFIFERHGGAVVFFGRFIALLRMLAALLAGVNCMRWWRFLFFNMAGGATWAAVFGLGAYIFGEQVHRLSRPMAVASFAVATLGAIGAMWFVRRHETALEDEAERAMPGPLPPAWRDGI